MQLINYATAYACMLSAAALYIRIVLTSETTIRSGEFRFKHGDASVYYIMWCIDNRLYRDEKLTPCSVFIINVKRGMYGENKEYGIFMRIADPFIVLVIRD